MAILLIRTLILYVFIVVAVRIMGKRQISDLQPSELVITMIIADIASIPMQDNSIPLISGIAPMMVLVACEITVSVLMMKNSRFRRLICGAPVIIIEDGKLSQDGLRRLRMTTEDLFIQLRQEGIFSLEDVQYCIAETNGKLSVLEKPEKRKPTAEDMKLSIEDEGIEAVVINGGEFLATSMKLTGTDEKELNKILQKNNIKPKDIFLMTYKENGDYRIVRVEK